MKKKKNDIRKTENDTRKNKGFRVKVKRAHI